MLPLRMLGSLMFMFLLCDAVLMCPTESNPLIVDPPVVIGEYGNTVFVNCSSKLDDHEGMYWIQTGNKTEKPRPDMELEHSFVNWPISLSDWDVTAECKIHLQFWNCSKELELMVYKTPDIVSVSARDPGPMVEGKDYLLDCRIINVAPVQKLKVKWYKGNETVHTQIFNDTTVAPVDASSNLIVTPARNYNSAIFRCEAELHLGPKGPQLIPTSSLPYIALVHYKPVIQDCPGQYTGVEKEFRIAMLSCQADGNPAPTVQWYYEGKPINTSELLTRTHSGKYTAGFKNYLGVSNTSVDITIEYSPSFTCDDRYKVEEHGKLQTDCEPKGIPKPVVTWLKDGNMKTSPHWTKHDSGEYLLQATNKHGRANHTLYIDVLYAPVFKEGNYSKEVTQGENVTFHCYAEGNPTPKIQWNYTDAGNVMVTTGGHQAIISVTGATSTNAGVYICVASNSVGHVTRSVTLIMKGQTITGLSLLIWGLMFLLLIVFIIMIMIIMIIMIIKICFDSRSKKQGQYSFVPAKPKDGSGIPMTTQSNGVQS